MKLVVFLFLLSSFGLAQQPATTSGACSPIAPNNSGSITIHCPKLSQDERDALRKLLNEVLAHDFNSMMTMLESIQSQVTTTGVLEPDTRPDPEFTLPGRRITIQPDALNVFFGSNLASFTGQKCTILSIAGKDVLWVERSPNGILISAKVFDPDKKIMAKIDNNKVTVNPNNTFRREIKKHTLVVVSQSDKEVLNVDFVNPHSVVINGIFPWDGYGPVIADKTMLSFGRNNTMLGNFTNCARGVALTLEPNGGFKL